MKPRALAAIALALGLLAGSVPSTHAEDVPEDAPKRQRLRRQVMLLRAELAELATQVNFTSKALAERPLYPDGSLCSDPCATDSDGDGLGDCADYCPCDPNTDDNDADAIPDCADPCPDDAVQACIDPCNMDSDGDGKKDCEDPCPWDPAPSDDEDNDNIPDCQDYCPGDPANLCFEPCKIDRDGDGVADCDDVCPWESGVPEPGDATSMECLPPPVGN